MKYKYNCAVLTCKDLLTKANFPDELISKILYLTKKPLYIAYDRNRARSPKMTYRKVSKGRRSRKPSRRRSRSVKKRSKSRSRR